MGDAVAALRIVLSKYPGVRLAYLFGSRARGVAKPLSDVDLAVLVDDLSILLDLSADVAKVLGVPEERVSLADLRILDPALILKIVGEGVEIVNRGVNVHDLIPGEVVEIRELERSLDRNWLYGNPLDVEVIRDIVTRIVEDAGDLKEMLSMGFENVTGDKHLRRSFERVFQTLIESYIDLLRHVVAGLNLGLATYYKDYVDIAEKSHTISKTIADKLRSLIPMRHTLAHRYRRLNYAELWRLAKDASEVADAFIGEVRKYLREKAGTDL